MTPERYEFLKSLRQWDVIRFNGKLRVVREVKWVGMRGFFTFSILRCSWTKRPYTVYNSTDLGNPKFNLELVFRNYRPKLILETVLQKTIQRDQPSRMLELNCCDVVGIIS